jgi:iron complex transport system substrate-binding protein
VEHALGETEVPVSPGRVVALDPYVTLPTAVLLGVPVVGAGYIPAGEPFPPFLGEEETEGIENVGWLEPNLEALAALDPDLIIGVDSFITGETYPELSQVAPSVAVEFRSPDWKENVLQTADALGKRQEAEREISAYEERIAAFKSAMGGRLDGLEVSLLNIRDAQDIRIYTEQDITGAILKEAGLDRPENQRTSDPEEGYIGISQELLSRADADVIFYFLGSAGGDYEDSQKEFEGIRDNPLWQKLEAVRNGRAYRVDPGVWFASGSVQAAHAILDDLEKHLLEGGS